MRPGHQESSSAVGYRTEFLDKSKYQGPIPGTVCGIEFFDIYTDISILVIFNRISDIISIYQISVRYMYRIEFSDISIYQKFGAVNRIEFSEISYIPGIDCFDIPGMIHHIGRALPSIPWHLRTYFLFFSPIIIMLNGKFRHRSNECRNRKKILIPIFV